MYTNKRIFLKGEINLVRSTENASPWAVHGQGHLTIKRKTKKQRMMEISLSSPAPPPNTAMVINNFISGKLTVLNVPDHVFFAFQQTHIQENDLAFQKQNWLSFQQNKLRHCSNSFFFIL